MKKGLGISKRLGQPRIYEDNLVRIEEYPEMIHLVYELRPGKISSIGLPRSQFYSSVLPQLRKLDRIPKDWRVCTL